MDYDELNEKVGGCGPYHSIAFFLLALTAFKQVVNLQGLTFAVYEPTHRCDIAGMEDLVDFNMTGNILQYISNDQCSYRLNNRSDWIPCQKWIYDKTVFQSSLVTEFNLICAKGHYKSLFYTVFFISELIGFLFIILSDKIGRKFLLFLFLYMSIPITIIQVLVYNIWVQFVFIFLTGLSTCVFLTIALTILVEIIPNKRFDLAVTNFFMFYSIGYMSTAVCAYFGRNWRIVYLMSIMLSVFYPLYICFVPETPRWLMLNGRKEESYKVLLFIAKINKRNLDRNDFNKWKPKKDVTGNIWLILKYKRMIIRCLIIIITAWSFSFAYIGISTDLTFASDNIFITTLVMGMIEIPTGPLASFVSKLMSRLNGMTFLCLIGIICLISLPFIESDLTKSSWQPWLKVVLAMAGKLGFTSAWCIFDLITNEVFPTSIRSSGISIAYIFVSLGSVFAPTINQYAMKWYYAAPCLIYAIHLIVTIILIRIFLPETKGLPLSQTIEEAAALEKYKELEWKTFMTEKLKNTEIVEEQSAL